MIAGWSARFVLLSATVAMAVAPTAAASTVGSSGAGDGCGWGLEVNAATWNLVYPETYANYWMLRLPKTPGVSVTLHGRYPHARYMSLESYHGIQLIDGLNDQQIQPDPGNADPFLAGADRNDDSRTYTVHIVSGPAPADPPPNTLYTSTPGTSSQGNTIGYRIYRTDEGEDASGGTGLPTITLTDSDGSTRQLPACPIAPVPDPAAVYPGILPVPLPGSEWRKKNSASSTFGNPDNSYLISNLNVPPGQVAVITGKLPTTPATFQGEPTMGTGQLRHWSMCSNEPLTTRVVSCVIDDQTVVDGDREYTIAVSAPADRPPDANPGCGIGWLATAGPTTQLWMRNMLPDSTFPQSIQAATIGSEAATMGPYFPTTRLMSTDAAAALPCPAATGS